MQMMVQLEEYQALLDEEHHRLAYLEAQDYLMTVDVLLHCQ
jgi:hypothetical protein